MYAEDIAPSRLVRARQKLLDLLNEKTEGTTGLIAYAGDAHVVSPLTDDLRTVANLLPALEPGIMPVRGSRPGPAVEQAVRLLRDGGMEHGQILLVTDGVSHAGQESIGDALADTGYRLSVLGVGTSDGAPIPTSEGFLRDAEGNIVVPGLDRQPLRALAARFGGHYSDIQLGDGDIDRILGSDVWGDTETEQLLDRRVDTWQDMGYWLVLMLIPIALGAFRRGWLLCLLLLPATEPVQAQDWQGLFLNRDQRGSELLRQGDAEAAAETFKDPDWAAVANYRAGNFQAAAERYRQGDDADSWYNRGNALARSGELREAIAAYDEALKREDDMEDAAYNKALLEQLLEQQQNQEQGDQSSDDRNQQKNDEQSQQQGQSSEGDGEQQQSASSGGQDSQPPEDAGGRRDSGQRQNDRQDSATAETGTEQQADDGRQPQPGKPEQGDGQEALAQRDAEDIEREMANEQWLRRIPDDPSGLLRRKFLYESRLRAAENAGNTRKQQDEETW